MNTTENIVQQFEEWLLAFVEEAGDTPTAIARLRTLTDLKKSIMIGISELEKVVTAEVLAPDEGQTKRKRTATVDTPLGAVTARSGPERYQYPKADDDQNGRFIDAVIARIIDSIDADLKMRPTEQVARKMVSVFPCTVSSARVGATENLGLSLYDYGKQGVGRKETVQLL